MSIRRFVFALSLGILLCNPLWAAPEKAAPSAEFFQLSNQALYKQLRIALDHIDDTATGLELKLSDVRISPLIRAEQWYEYPLECGLVCDETTLPLFLKKLFGFSFADGKLGFGAISISTTAESHPDGVPLLSATLNAKYLVGRLDPNAGTLAAHSAIVVSAFSRLFKLTTMTPQVRRRVDKAENQLRGGKTWLTNIRVDMDHRVQMTGYALDAKQVTALGEDLYSCGSFDEVFICSYSKNVYEKVPVYRFDIVAKLK